MINKPKIAEHLEERGYRLTEIAYDIHWPGCDVTVLKINKVGAIELSKKFHVGEFDLKTSKECAEHIADKFDELLEQKLNYQCPHCEPDYLPVMCPDKIADECEHKDICVAVERGKSVEPFVNKHLKEGNQKMRTPKKEGMTHEEYCDNMPSVRCMKVDEKIPDDHKFVMLFGMIISANPNNATQIEIPVRKISGVDVLSIRKQMYQLVDNLCDSAEDAFQEGD